MVQKKYGVQLTSEERERLRQLIRSGQHSARVITRARILLRTDEGWSASQVAAALDTSQRTVLRTKRRYAEEGLDGVLHDHPQANRYRKLDDRGEAHLIALACSDAPEGHDHWTLRLLADQVVELGLVESLSHETVRLRLKKHPPAVAEATVVHPQGERGVCGGHGGRAGPLRGTLRPRPAGGVLRRDLHPTAGRYPHATARPAGTPATPGLRVPPGGTRNLFLTCEPLAGWRHVAITERRTMQDFAHQMRWLVDVAYPHAPVVRVVLDNLNTHRMASLYEAFPAAEARRIVKRLEFHHTPKHASWLNMAEIEFSVLTRACLQGRNPDADALQLHITAYETQRNAAGATINWRFSTQDARNKLQRFYPCHSNID